MDSSAPSEQNNIIQQLQAEIGSLQSKLQQTGQALTQANQAYAAVTAHTKSLRVGKPDKFSGTNVRSWSKSLENVFDAESSPLSEQQKLKYAVSYMTGEGLQWWELLTINNRNIETFTEFKVEMLNYFEPENRELTARKTLSNLKQMGSLNAVRAYNKEFSKWLPQIPTMAPAEQIFHYSQGLKHRTRIEVERSEPTTLQEAMRIAGGLDSLYNGNNTFMGFGAHIGGSDGPTPMQIGTIPQKRYNRLSYAEKKRRIEQGLCFICEKPKCVARNHRGKARYKG